MTYRVDIAPRAYKFIKNLPQHDKERVLACVLSLQDDPWIGKKLKGELAGFYVIRAWPYRIIYEIRRQECLVLVVRAGRRRDVYK